jgi:EAL and modified HD-GYP domain-containing signal transduction protein
VERRTVPSTHDQTTNVYVARQPILDAAGAVFGYELLYRSGHLADACSDSSDVTAVRALNDAVLAVGLETLTGGLPAFINMTRHLLLSDVVPLLASEAVVIEVLETVSVDDEVFEKCRDLHAHGYRLALDDFVPGSPAERLLPFACIVKVDVLAIDEPSRRQLRRTLPPRIKLLAEKVETHEMYAESRDSGYEYFQGYHFCRPTTFATGKISSKRLASAQLLAALNQPRVTTRIVEDLIKRDPSLIYRVLRCVNSAAFGVKREVQSIHQAVMLLGLDRVRQWASIWAMAGLNDNAGSELVSIAVLRARTCELLIQERHGQDDGAGFFLLGLCSLLDVMLGRPMTEAVDAMPIAPGVRAALLGTRNHERLVLDAVIAYERGQWAAAGELAAAAGLPTDSLATAYADALQWVHDLQQAAA